VIAHLSDHWLPACTVVTGPGRWREHHEVEVEPYRQRVRVLTLGSYGRDTALSLSLEDMKAMVRGLQMAIHMLETGAEPPFLDAGAHI
jgi:hypothetical protein